MEFAHREATDPEDSGRPAAHVVILNPAVIILTRMRRQSWAHVRRLAEREFMFGSIVDGKYSPVNCDVGLQ